MKKLAQLTGEGDDAVRAGMQLIATLDMLKDGITPPNTDIISAMLGICEAQKKFFFALGGLLANSTDALAKIHKAAPSTYVEETEETAAMAFEEPPVAEAEADDATEAKTSEDTPAESPKDKADKPEHKSEEFIRPGTELRLEHSGQQPGDHA